MRLKMNPVLSRRTRKGRSPYSGKVAMTKSSTSCEVLPHDITSTAIRIGGM
jgi:hypothetical protein